MTKRKLILRAVLLLILVGAGVYRWVLKPAPLAERLVSVNNDTRTMALSEMAKLDDKSRSELSDAILKLPPLPDPKARRYKLYVLRVLSGARPDIIALNVEAMVDPDPAVREEALVSLTSFGEAGLPALFQILKTSQGPAQQGVLEAIARSEAKAGPEWKELFKSKDPALRLLAAESLDHLGLLGKDATPVLTADLLISADSYSDVNAPRPRLARLLEKTDPRRRQMVDLSFDLKQPNVLVRYRAAVFLSDMNPPNIGALEMLTGAMADKDAYVAGRAAFALSKMDPQSRERLAKVISTRLKALLPRAQAAQIGGLDLLQKLSS